jgi:hypothetical protein
VAFSELSDGNKAKEWPCLAVNWTVATYAAPWAPRAFHDVVVWHDPVNITQDVSGAGRNMSARIWVSGGGYMGQKDNKIVYLMKGYIDLWWTRDGGESTQGFSS